MNLIQPEWQGARFLVVGANFGCGSSREYAVWGMKQMGIRGLIGTSFAGIFDDNCQRNGVLNIKLSQSELEKISRAVSDGTRNEIEVDLPAQLIKFDGDQVIEFEIDPLIKTSLIEGLDAIDKTLQRKSMIEAFEQRHLQDNPWLDGD
jgi:3-isopropylmalate/(R)-2-methylmalate dehydratase small subunit